MWLAALAMSRVPNLEHASARPARPAGSNSSAFFILADARDDEATLVAIMQRYCCRCSGPWIRRCLQLVSKPVSKGKAAFFLNEKLWNR